MDTAKEISQDKAEVNEKDDIIENYGKEENDQIFKQNVYTKKSKLIKYSSFTPQIISMSDL